MGLGQRVTEAMGLKHKRNGVSSGDVVSRARDVKGYERLLTCGNSWLSERLSSEQRREFVQPEILSFPELSEGRQVRQRESRRRGSCGEIPSTKLQLIVSMNGEAETASTSRRGKRHKREGNTRGMQPVTTIGR